MNDIYSQDINSRRKLDEKLTHLTSLPPSSSAIPVTDQSSLLGLFGEAAQGIQPVAKTLPKEIVKSGPTGLQGVFIDAGQAWAIVNNRDKSSSIIQPEQIISFNNTSITVQTRSGIKSLHLKRDTKGINIRAINKTQIANSTTPSRKKQPSRAEQLRLKLLNAARHQQ